MQLQMLPVLTYLCKKEFNFICICLHKFNSLYILLKKNEVSLSETTVNKQNALTIFMQFNKAEEKKNQLNS